MTKNNKTQRTFHWYDNGKRSVEITSSMMVSFVYSNSMSMEMSAEQFDSLIEFVYSETKKRRLDQKEVKSANS